MRPGCDRTAAARLTYDTVACAVWLDAPGESGGQVQQVCDLHASALTAPRGWTVTDRRDVAATAPVAGRRAEPSPAASSVPTTDPPRHAPAEPAPSTAPRQDSRPEEAPPQEARPQEARPQEARPQEARPQDVPAQEPTPPAEAGRPAASARRGARPPADGSLLRRAFEWTGPQHSVLTSPPGDDPDEGLSGEPPEG